MRLAAIEGYTAKLDALHLCLDYKSIAAIRHCGSTKENPHFHLVVETDVQPQAFRVRMRKIFDQGKGNEHMALKPWDGRIEAYSYLFHEEPQAPLLIQHNISDETIAEARKINQAVTALVMERKGKAAWTLEIAVFDEISQQGRPASYWNDVRLGQKLILTALRSDKYVPQPWHLRAMVQRIQYRLLGGDEESEEQLALRLAEQVFYDR